jgi:hypothetical protein
MAMGDERLPFTHGNGLSPIMHALVGVLSGIPEPAWVLLCVGASAAASVSIAAWVQRKHPRFVPWLQNALFVRNMVPTAARDAPFALIYALFTWVTVLLLALLCTLISPVVPMYVLMCACCSIVGVFISVWIDGEMCFVDTATTLAVDAQRSESTRRRVFLHVWTGAVLAMVLLYIARQQVT